MMACIPGLEHLEKEGWDLVSFRRVVEGESYIDRHGKVKQWQSEIQSESSYLVVCKVVKPDEYRPFENLEEAEPYFDDALRLKDGLKGILRVVCMVKDGVVVGTTAYTYKEAFEKFINQHGTPFGVKIDS
jgi:hypothetical protein